MFEDSTFESAGRIHTRSRRWMIAAFTLNSSILLALILIPLIDPEALPRQFTSFLVEAPLPPSTPERPKPQPTHAAPGPTQMNNGHFAAPTTIPKIILVVDKPEAAPSVDVSSTLGPDSNGSNGSGVVFPGQTSRPVVRTEPKGPVRVSLGVANALLIRKTLPVYPSLARAMRVEGTVVLAATISKNGTIENLRVVSGSPMLQQAALDAVKTWLYRPYLLDGEPVEVETTVSVIFTLGR
jgi:protein TonB